jgi:hypothetical protein
MLIYSQKREKMDWSQFVILCSGILILFLWKRAEDRLEFQLARGLLKDIHEDLKDFHERSLRHKK